MRRRRLWPNSWPIIVLCCLGLLIGACGKKGPPKPPLKKTLPKVRDLQAVLVNAGVELTWSLDSLNRDIVGFNVYRSKPQAEISDCPGCPRDYELITAIRVKAGQTRFEFVDAHIEGKGRFYYKVAPFDKRDRAGPDSKEARILIE
jgi:hypothetical protein